MASYTDNSFMCVKYAFGLPCTMLTALNLQEKRGKCVLHSSKWDQQITCSSFFTPKIVKILKNTFITRFSVLSLYLFFFLSIPSSSMSPAVNYKTPSHHVYPYHSHSLPPPYHSIMRSDKEQNVHEPLNYAMPCT